MSKNSWKENPSVLRVFPSSGQFTYTKMWSRHLAITPNLSLWRDLEILRLSFFEFPLFSVFSPSPERPQWAQELECQLPSNALQVHHGTHGFLPGLHWSDWIAQAFAPAGYNHKTMPRWHFFAGGMSHFFFVNFYSHRSHRWYIYTLEI